MREHDQLFIGGRWEAPAGNDVTEVISPPTEQVVGRLPLATEADIDRAVAAAREAFDHGPWPRMAPAERIETLNALAGLYASRLQDLNEAIIEEMGCPIAFAMVGPGADAPDDPELISADRPGYPWEDRRPRACSARSSSAASPIGVVAAITPWNVPQFTVHVEAAPALLGRVHDRGREAGRRDPARPLVLARGHRAGRHPRGRRVSILPASREVGEHLVRHPGVDKVAFTGSTAAGRQIAAICGEQLKRCQPGDSGGKSAAIVLDDADMDRRRSAA